MNEIRYGSFFGNKNVTKIPFGGDYNPEQWPEEVWDEDMRLFALAGVDCVTLNVFSWASLQPDEDTYCFDKLDKVMELVKKNGLHVILATSTAAHPAWMARKGAGIIPVRTVRCFRSILSGLRGRLQKDTKSRGILLPGISEMSMAEPATASGAKRHFGCG